MADASGFRKQADTPAEVQTRFKLCKRVGKGSYGTVYEADDVKTGQKVALKCIEGVFNTVVDAKRTLREICILRQSSHINIVECVTVLRPPNPASFTNLWVVLGMCKWDLGKVMRLSKSFKGWSDQHVKFILYQTLCGMNYLHNANIVHRDLKPSNLLVTEKCEIRICDFGLSREIKPKNPLQRTRSQSVGDAAGGGMPGAGLPTQLTKHVVTRWYRAPELMLLATDYGGAIDVWSMGCIFAELLQTLEPVSDSVAPPSRTLFPGESCYPLSQTSDEGDVDVETLKDELGMDTHQLNVIFNLLGTPDAEDLALIQSPVLKRCITEWVAAHPKTPVDLTTKYRAAPPDGLELLVGMLRFNPAKRLTIADAMAKSVYLKDSHIAPSAPRDDSRDKLERGSDITCDFEKIPSIGGSQLRELLIQECDTFAAEEAARMQVEPAAEGGAV